MGARDDSARYGTNLPRGGAARSRFDPAPTDSTRLVWFLLDSRRRDSYARNALLASARRIPAASAGTSYRSLSDRPAGAEPTDGR